MNLKNIDIIASPDSKGKIRLTGQVFYDDREGQPELYWFEVSEEYREFLSGSGNPWLICLLPLAVTLGEPLRINLPVDEKLLENTKKLMSIWKCWYPHLHIVPIEAMTIEKQERQQGQKIASFFSGGVDSFFTVLRQEDPKTKEPKTKIDELLYVWGFDLPLKNTEAFKNLRGRLREAASGLEKGFVEMATNLRTTRWANTNWHDLAHGCALAAAGLVLEGRYKQILIASTEGYLDLKPSGSHVLTDPLLSTSQLTFIHDGALYNRTEKTAFVGKSEIAMRSLHVCWRSGSDINCSRCSKCYRTMIMLDVLGLLQSARTFDVKKYKISGIRKIFLEHEYDRKYALQIRSYANQQGRLDIVRAIDGSLQHTDRINRYIPIIGKFCRWLNKRIFVWRWSHLPKQILLANSII